MKNKLALIIFLLSITLTNVYAEELDFKSVNIDASCNNIFTPEALELVRTTLDWFRIIAPILLILLVAVDMIQAVLSDDKQLLSKAIGKTTKRILATICVFLVPTFIVVISKLPGVENVLSSDPLCSSATGSEAKFKVRVAEPKKKNPTVINNGTINNSSTGTSGSNNIGNNSYSYSEGSGNESKRSYKTVTINGRTYDMYRQSYLEDISYQSGNLALYGCGPISFATAASGFNDSITAYDAAKLVKSRSFSGIKGAFDKIGIAYDGPYYYNSNDRDEQKVAEMAALARAHFAKGKPIIALVTGGNNGERKYATNNHFITLLGEVNGEVIISNCATERGNLEEIIRYYLKGGKKGFLLVG